jgi:hypothetical protein
MRIAVADSPELKSPAVEILSARTSTQAVLFHLPRPLNLTSAIKPPSRRLQHTDPLHTTFVVTLPEQHLLTLTHTHTQLEPVLAATLNMRAASILALGCYAAVSSAKDILDDIEDSAQEATSSVASAVESVTSSAIEKPTFTVSTAKYELSNPSRC